MKATDGELFLFFVVDSDDFLTNNALKRIMCHCQAVNYDEKFEIMVCSRTEFKHKQINSYL
jgi:hypothetical protein